MDFIAEESAVLNQPIYGDLGESSTYNKPERFKKILATQQDNDVKKSLLIVNFVHIALKLTTT